MSINLTQAKKTEIVGKAKSVIILCLVDKVLKESTMEKIVEELWIMLEKLCLTS